MAGAMGGPGPANNERSMALWTQAAALDVVADTMLSLTEILTKHVDGLDLADRHDLYAPIDVIDLGVAALVDKVQGMYDRLRAIDDAERRIEP